MIRCLDCWYVAKHEIKEWASSSGREMEWGERRKYGYIWILFNVCNMIHRLTVYDGIVGPPSMFTFFRRRLSLPPLSSRHNSTSATNVHPCPYQHIMHAEPTSPSLVPYRLQCPSVQQLTFHVERWHGLYSVHPLKPSAEAWLAGRSTECAQVGETKAPRYQICHDDSFWSKMVT